MTESAITVRPASQFDLSPQSFEQALTFAQYLADSDMVPKDFKGKPANCLIGMQWGMELGMKPLQAIQNIAIINGRPNLWGDAMLALVRSSPLCEWVTEGWHSDGTAYCKAKRRGEPEQIREYSDADAKLAGLIGKQGPWTTGPKRMKQLRARAFALRDVFTDVLRGMGMAEEALDTPTKEMGHAEIVGAGAAQAEQGRAVLPAYPADAFNKKLPTWKKNADEGGNVADLIYMLSSKYTLSAEQLRAINALAVTDVEEPASAAEQEARDEFTTQLG